MNERIRQLAISNGIYDCITDPYDLLKNGDPYSSVMVDLERFAELIVQDCLNICEEMGDNGKDGHYCADAIIKLFKCV